MPEESDGGGPKQATPPDNWGPTDEELLQAMEEMERRQFEDFRAEMGAETGDTALDTPGGPPAQTEGVLSEHNRRRRRMHAIVIDEHGSFRGT